MVCSSIKNNSSDSASNNNKCKGVSKRSLKKKNSSNITSCLLKEKKKFLMEQEFTALRSILPSNTTSSPLEVVLEAIEYIQRLEKQLSIQDPQCIMANMLRSKFMQMNQ